MSQIVTRKSAVSEEKEKRTDSPVKDMKKKVAANAEKEKQAAEKPAEKQPEKTEKPKQAEKPAEKNEKPKQPEKPSEKTDKQKQPDKPTEKNEKQKQPEKATEKDKPADKSAEKTEKKVEKNGVENKKTDKKDTQEKKDDKAEKNAKADAKKNGEKSKQNGSKHNGVETNGVEEAASDDDVLEIADDEFPELAYDDTSDNESPTPDSAPGRSATRRSQVKATRTPETPQPAAPTPAHTAHTAPAPAHTPAAHTGATEHDPKDSKVLKLSEAPPSDRKLRSDDAKPDKRDKDGSIDDSAAHKQNGDDKDGDLIDIDGDDEPRKTDTNFSKSRVKVSPYRRSTRLADQTTSSVMANYTGNNTTMEMDITESSISEDVSLDDSSYLSGLRSIRGRRSYKPLKELAIKHVNRSAHYSSTTSVTVSESRPTGTVVGRKRKPDALEGEARGGTSTSPADGELPAAPHTKRMRLLHRIAHPFRRTLASTPLASRRNPEIVGINTDLPLTAPVASPSTFDPESLKTAPPTPHTPHTPAAHTAPADDADKKRCIVM